MATAEAESVWPIVQFLDTHQGTASAIFAAIIALAVIAYVWYTRRLWQQTRAAAVHARRQADLVAQQAELARAQAQQTQEQLNLLATQVNQAAREVEVRLRPYLAVRLKPHWAVQYAILYVEVRLHNVGPVPANLKSFRFRAWSDDRLLFDGDNRGRTPVVFPGEQVRGGEYRIDIPREIERYELPLRLRVEAEYAAPWGGVFTTESEVRREATEFLFLEGEGRMT